MVVIKMKQTYRAICFGYEDLDRGISIKPHEVSTDHYVMPGSHILCPDCAKRFFEDIEKLESRVEKTVA